MKKFVTKPRIVLAILVVTFVALRYYIKPEWFDREHVYYKVYNYQIRDIKPEKKIIKDITVNFVHRKGKQIPEGDDVTEDIMSMKEVNLLDNFSQVHITFTDNTQVDLHRVYNFDVDFNRLLFDKLSLRFPDFHYKASADYLSLSAILRLYPGDTLFQVPSNNKEISYQVENPKTGEMQTYYEYGPVDDEKDSRSVSSFSWTPRYFILSSDLSSDERQEFFDDYNNMSPNNFRYRYNYTLYGGLVTDTFLSNKQTRTKYFSRDFKNIPFSVSTTGSHFKTTIRDIYISDSVNWDQYHVKIRTKTYTEENKDEYITEVLDKKINRKK